MPLCETITSLVDSVMDAAPDASQEDLRWAAAIRSIVAYRDSGRLDEWESEVNRAAPPVRATPIQEMLGELEMLGLANLYQAFDVARTNKFYNQLRPYFKDRGVDLPISPDLNGW